MTEPDILIPFFTYGLFKPGQPCFNRIEKYVKEKIEAKIPGILKIRDGVPVLERRANSSDIKGFILEFINGKEKEAYDVIMAIEPKYIYDWDIIRIRSKYPIEKVNYLKGKRGKLYNDGCHELEGIDDWDVKYDPIFGQGFEEIKSIIDNEENKMLKSIGGGNYDYKPFFRLQMAYSFLWVIIERFGALCFHLGDNPKIKRKMIEESPNFIKCKLKYKNELLKLNSFLKGASLSEKEESIEETEFNIDKPLEYFYNLRSNVVHRGKSISNEFHLLKDALNILYKIFYELIYTEFNIKYDTE